MMDWEINGFAWVALTFYFVCFIPQILENSRLKSTRGLSDFSIYLFYLFALSAFFYTFLTDLPLPYKSIAPLQGVAMIILMMQRMYYGGFSVDKFYSFIVILATVVALGCISLALCIPEIVAPTSGWICVVTAILQLAPQGFKVFREKSVHGFSFGFVALRNIAVASEVTFAFLRPMPIQTVAMITVGVIFQAIFSVQFWLYGKKPHR